MKSVLVTGGTRRLGKAIADVLRARGWRVVASSHRPDAGADVVADLSEPMGAARLYAATCALLGGTPPDALVNNAALFAGEPEALRMVNLESPWKLTMMMAGREEGVGAVVNVLDARLAGGAPDSPPGAEYCAEYCRTKRELADRTAKGAAMFMATLRVNAVAPGPVLPPEGAHVKARETPLGRPTAEAVAEAVAFLVEARFTTGCTVVVDGGESIAAAADLV